MNNKVRVRYGNYGKGRKAIMIDLLVNGEWSLSTAYPIENFGKNVNLPQLLINKLYELNRLGYEIQYEVKEIEED